MSAQEYGLAMDRRKLFVIHQNGKDISLNPVPGV
jgi:hypothetical protein